MIAFGIKLFKGIAVALFWKRDYCTRSKSSQRVVYACVL